ncbi:MAG: hypothetical protein AB8G11_10640 [Saprospiraceae bacterium]
MNKLLTTTVIVSLLLIGCRPTSKLPRTAKPQEDYLFKELTEQGLYLGLSQKEFQAIRPNAEENSDGYDFRTIFVDEAFSERFMNVIYYFDNDGEKPLYELILIVNPNINADKLAKEHFGLPNYQDKEWRFPSVQTDLPFTLAVWTYNNKIIIAATMKDTEWEKGIE